MLRQKKIVKKKESLKENLKDVLVFRDKIINTIKNKKIYGSKNGKENEYKKIFKDDINLNCTFKKGDAKKELEGLLTNIQDTEESINNYRGNTDISYLRNIPDSLIRFISKIFLGNVDSLEKAYNEYNVALNRSDVKNL